jgi:hypothetical protein
MPSISMAVSVRTRFVIVRVSMPGSLVMRVHSHDSVWDQMQESISEKSSRCEREKDLEEGLLGIRVIERDQEENHEGSEGYESCGS